MVKPSRGAPPSPKTAREAKLIAQYQRTLNLVALLGTRSDAARAQSIPIPTAQSHINAARRLGLVPDPNIKPISAGRDHVFRIRSEKLPARGKIKRYLCTSAQNNTKVFADFWKNLLAMAKVYHADVLISRYTYNAGAYFAMGGESEKESADKVDDEIWYDPVVVPYLCDDRVVLAPGLSWCGEVNIIPTAARPLSGFESYTGRDSGIFPHAKIAMDSVASGKFEATKFNYTTGTVTQRNYIQRKAGLKAEFHHAYGALLVEVDHHGNWFCRQINADNTGTIYDLDMKVSRGRVTRGHRVAAITYGDIHRAQICGWARDLTWGKGGMCDTLRPWVQFFHDVLDMLARNHHDANDPHRMFSKFVRGQDSVLKEITDVATFLNWARRSFAASVIVDSNHQRHLLRWLREADFRKDPTNAEFYLDAQRAVYDAIRRDDKRFDLFEWAVRRVGGSKALRFLREDESYIICRQAGDGIECSMHGDNGPNGARATLQNLARLGRKSNVGHSHSAAILDGVYRAGTKSEMDLGYNKGPSSWSHSDIVTYANGKRAIITMWNGKWRA